MQQQKQLTQQLTGWYCLLMVCAPRRETSPITLPSHRYVAAAAGAFMAAQAVVPYTRRLKM